MLDLGDGDETGTGSHKAYMMAAWWRGIRASAQGVVWPGARCQVPGGGEAAEGREEERVQPRCPSPGVASVGLACRYRRSRQVARRDDRWLPETARQGQGRTGAHLLSALSASGIWLEPPLFAERRTRLPGTSFTCPARRERGEGQAVADGPAISAAQKPQHDNWPATEEVQGTAGRGSREEQ